MITILNISFLRGCNFDVLSKTILKKTGSCLMDDTWIQYHATRLNLIQSIETHLKSVAAVNVYNNGSRKDIPLNTSGDYNLTNELMGYDLMNELKNKLTVEVE
jgi:hypothetical protein